MTPVERTIMVIRSDLDALRESRARAKSFLRILGEDGTDLQYPDSFITASLAQVVGDYKGTKVTLNEYITTTLHMKVTAVLHGPPEVGKTPLAEAIAARFAMMYQDSSILNISNNNNNNNNNKFLNTKKGPNSATFSLRMWFRKKFDTPGQHGRMLRGDQHS